MKNHNKFNAIFALLIAAIIGLACSMNQQADANKIVDEANKKLEEAKDLYVKTEQRNKALFGTNIQSVQELQAYKSKMTGEAKSIVAEYEKVSEMLKDISKKYDEVSRMKLDEKYKDYAKLKSDEFAKRAEAVTIRKGNAQAFAEIDDPRAMNTKFEENNSNSNRLFKDAEDLSEKAKKMEEDNKEIFRQS